MKLPKKIERTMSNNISYDVQGCSLDRFKGDELIHNLW